MTAAAKLDWTPERVADLKRMAVAGASALEIAQRFGISKNAAQTKMSKVGGRTVLSWIQKERIVELHRLGWRDRRIALQMGIGEGDVMRHLHLSGLRVVEDEDIREVKLGGAAVREALATGQKKLAWTEDDDDRLRELTEAGETADAIGKIMGRTGAAVATRRSNLGLSSRVKRDPAASSDVVVPQASAPAPVVETVVPVTPVSPTVQTLFLVHLGAEMAATQARIADLTATLDMMRALAAKMSE